MARGARPDGLDSRLVSYTDKDSYIAEQYRMLQAYLHALAGSIGGDKSLKSIMITSSLPLEGKTITCGNLAITLASSGEKKVVLVDCDLRKPDIHKIFNVSRSPGISDIINGKCSVNDILKAPAFGNLYILPSGSEISNVYELLRCREMRELFDALKPSFDYVIIDTPPVMPVFDSRILGGMCDAVILVARCGATSKKTAKEAFNLLDTTHSKPIGCILTDYQAPLYRYEGYSPYLRAQK